MQTATGGVADVHTGPFAHMFEIAEVLKIFFGVLSFCFIFFDIIAGHFLSLLCTAMHFCEMCGRN